jgi:hypothetical protein
MDYSRAERIVRAGVNAAVTSQASNHIDAVQITSDGYAEPGYTDPEGGLIAFGDWNEVSHWDAGQRKFVVDDDAPVRVAKLLEAGGVELEWSDEWTTCDHCGKALRTKADSYSWKRYYADLDSGIACGDCIKDDPAEYLKSLEGQENSCLTIDIDLEQHGYVLLEQGYEHGWYGGQDADPRLIARALKDQGVERFVFELDRVGQFDLAFSVFVHRDQLATLDHEAFDAAAKDGPSVAEGLRRSLEDATAKLATLPDLPGHPKVAHCDSSTGTATVRLVTPEEFLSGKSLAL